MLLVCRHGHAAVFPVLSNRVCLLGQEGSPTWVGMPGGCAQAVPAACRYVWSSCCTQLGGKKSVETLVLEALHVL